MKSFLTKIIGATLVLVSVLSCAEKKADQADLEDRNSRFFGIVYLAQASRMANSSSNWTTVEGQHRLKFAQSAGQDSEDFSSGDFTIQFSNYREAQLYNNPLCSGGYRGTFTVSEVVATEDDEDDSGQPYNPMNPYNSGIKEPNENTEEKDFYVFVFTLTVTEKSMSSGCNSISPPDRLTLRVIRYKNGDLIETNDQRGLDFYMIPELVQ